MPKALRQLDDLAQSGALSSQPTVLVRVDLNVPMSEGAIADDTRIREATPTLERLLGAHCRLVVCSHLGRPRGERVPELSLEPIATHLQTVLQRPVQFCTDCVGEERDRAASSLEPGGVVVLENLRFHPEEKAGDPAFAGQLASGCEVYVGDAFGTAHRAHASIVGAALALEKRAAGLLMSKEVKELSALINAPKRPFAAALGGAKIEGKIDTLENLVEIVDVLLLGGGMANTFLAARGHALGKSLFEPERLETAIRILERAKERGIQVLMPEDVVVTDSLAGPAFTIDTTGVDDIPENSMAVDIGPRTLDSFITALSNCASLFWNGPMGVFEKPPFDRGSLGFARALGEASSESGLHCALGGGETAALASLAEVTETITHVSTGGGASLQLLAGKPLPGVEVLRSST